MSVAQIVAQFPTYSSVVSPNWLEKESDWIVVYISDRMLWFRELEADLVALVKNGVPLQRLASCYRDSLRNRTEVQKAIYEVHGAAMLSALARRTELHVPRGDGSNRNFDVLVEIDGAIINADSKTRKDEFPFNASRIEEKVGAIFGGSRATMDPHDAADLGFPVQKGGHGPGHKATPESTVIRQILLDGIGQLPIQGCNLILFGQIDGNLDNLIDALFGTEYFEDRRDVTTGKFSGRIVRAKNGAFSGGDDDQAFRALSGVLWIRLWQDGGALRKTYRGFQNPSALTAVPEKVAIVLKALIESSEKESK